jgi:hypothetical protein
VPVMVLDVMEDVQYCKLFEWKRAMETELNFRHGRRIGTTYFYFTARFMLWEFFF